MILHSIELKESQVYAIETTLQSCIQGYYLGYMENYIFFGIEDCPQILYITDIVKIKEFKAGLININDLKRRLKENG